MAKLVLDNNEWAVKDSSFTNVATETINLTDGTWTLLDFAGTFKSVSFDSATGFNTVVLNARTASVDNRWDSGTNCTMPRWYKDFKIDGAQITNTELLSSVWRIESDLSNTAFNKSFVAGICIDPTSTVLQTINGCGAFFARNTTGAPFYGTWQINGAGTNSSNNNDYCIASILRGYGGFGSGTFMTINEGTDPDSIHASAGRNSNRNDDGATAGSNLRLIVGPGVKSNGDVLPADATYIINMRFTAFTIGNLT